MFSSKLPRCRICLPWFAKISCCRQHRLIAGVEQRSIDELGTIFDKLSDGADKELLVQLRDMLFGVYGPLTDRYGVESFFRVEKASD
jgi:hypothetical protein